MHQMAKDRVQLPEAGEPLSSIQALKATAKIPDPIHYFPPCNLCPLMEALFPTEIHRATKVVQTQITESARIPNFKRITPKPRVSSISR